MFLSLKGYTIRCRSKISVKCTSGTKLPCDFHGVKLFCHQRCAAQETQQHSTKKK